MCCLSSPRSWLKSLALGARLPYQECLFPSVLQGLGMDAALSLGQGGKRTANHPDNKNVRPSERLESQPFPRGHYYSSCDVSAMMGGRQKFICEVGEERLSCTSLLQFTQAVPAHVVIEPWLMSPLSPAVYSFPWNPCLKGHSAQTGSFPSRTPADCLQGDFYSQSVLGVLSIQFNDVIYHLLVCLSLSSVMCYLLFYFGLL